MGVELAEGGRAWRITVSAKDLTTYAESLKKHLEVLSARREYFGRYYDLISDMLSGGGRGIASPLASIEALWRGWVGALYPDLARTSKEREDVLYLLMLRPDVYLPFEHLNMLLLVSSLAINRQVAHIYSHMGWLFAEKAEEAAVREAAMGRRRVFRDVAASLSPLFVSEGWAKYCKVLDSVPERPVPSIYEQIFYTTTIVVGMLYNVLSSASTVLGLNPEIPPDPLDFIKERRPDLMCPGFSQSLGLLRRSAYLPVGILERYYLNIDDLLEMSALKEAVETR